MVVSVLLAAAAGLSEMPMPPPPPGMVLVAQAVAVAPAPSSTQPDGGTAAEAKPAPSTSARPLPVGEESEPDPELEALRALEEASIEPGPSSDASLRATIRRLGYGSQLRDRLEAALDEAALSGEEVPFELGLVNDVSSFDVSQVRNRYDIPVEMQPLVAKYIHFFQGAGRKWFRRWMNRATRFMPLMTPLLEEKGLPRDLVYLAMIESGFNTQAKSWARAVGPWQFIAGTAKIYGLKEDFWVDERRDPVKSTHAAARYLGDLHRNFGHWYLAWAGYNSGGGRVRRLIETYRTDDFWALADKKRGFAKETKHYVPKLIACALVARYPEAFGFSPEEFQPEPPFEFDEVKLSTQVDLEVLASAAGTTADLLRELNPEVKRWCTPPASEQEPYAFRIPKGTAGSFAQAFAKTAPTERLLFRIHRVQAGDTLSKIARRYRSAPEAILSVNGLRSSRMLRLGTDLAIPVPSTQALQSGRGDSTLERHVARARRSGFAALRPEEEIPAGSRPTKSLAAQGSVSVEKVGEKTRVSYGVARGDSLWSIARRFDVRVADLREWNEALGSARGLKVGTTLTIWPGAKATF